MPTPPPLPPLLLLIAAPLLLALPLLSVMLVPSLSGVVLSSSLTGGCWAALAARDGGAGAVLGGLAIAGGGLGLSSTAALGLLAGVGAGDSSGDGSGPGVGLTVGAGEGLGTGAGVGLNTGEGVGLGLTVGAGEGLGLGAAFSQTPRAPVPAHVRVVQHLFAPVMQPMPAVRQAQVPEAQLLVRHISLDLHAFPLAKSLQWPSSHSISPQQSELALQK